MKQANLFLLASLALASLAAAQPGPLDFSGANNLNNGRGKLFDPSRFTMQQSFSIGYAAWGKSSLLSNAYRNTMNYRLSQKLEIKLDLAYSYLPAAFNKSAYRLDSRSQGLFLPSFGLKYQPFQNMIIQFEYNSPGSYGSNYLLGR
ncbi:hypothetical protein HY768_03690 [candidate division TA06 bacterium]|uniref:PorT family protein n=1 Tax=candidate division TA06 bacterium TaxID=2250710 RepID=A0A933MK34_UNCT6|nr:hypothetical protein [candidate division TA06 bacterium]